MSAHPKRLPQINQYRPPIQQKEEQERSGPATGTALSGIAPGQVMQLPGRAAQALRQSAVLQMQRVQGNNFVQRAVEVGEVESQPIAAPTQIEGPGASVSVAGGTAEVTAPMVTVNAPFVRVSGILESDTLITNNVVASSYTPGAGNIW